MNAYKRISAIAGWIVFAVAFLVYFFSAERSGSLWDCGEFILGAYKLQVVHPPGAPLFLLIGRIFTMFAELFSNNPEDIAFAVNLMSGVSTAFATAFIAWITIMLGKLALVGREEATTSAQNIALAGAGIVAGLATAFSTSIWFSAVEGEVYAMSTFFTAMTLWATIKWYTLPDDVQNDRWLVFAIYSTGLSIGVHLLSILTLPALAMFYYFKRYKKHTLLGIVTAAAIGLGIVGAIQTLVIAGIPRLWASFELLMVNTFGLPVHSGLIPLILLIGAAAFFGLRYAHQKQNPLLQNLVVAALLIVCAYSTYGVVVARANTSTPINMNVPSDAMRLLPYLNREQYGERALLRGPNFTAQPIDVKSSDRYGLVDGKYEIVDQKLSYVYADKDKMLFPRMYDPNMGRPSLYRQWIGMQPNQPMPPGRPNLGDNIKFFWRYQFQWMYWRYFFWNFAGRQNGDQGFYSWDKSAGHWISGIPFIDNLKLGNQSKLPETWKDNKARNKYYMLPFLFGLLGLIFHFTKRREEFIGLLTLFVITGLGIIIYSNQPPNEPRERDYVLIGSFFTYCIWIGMGVLALFELLQERLKLSGQVSAIAASLVVFSAPLLMGTQNFDDHTRRYLKGSRDYAYNFLESCDPNAIIFTYGDNDTYPLWYAQEVEGIRTDVRVVNLSLIAVDWYIDLLRRKINDSPALNFTIPQEALRGRKRNQVLYPNMGQAGRPMDLKSFLQFIGEDHPLPLRNGRQTESYMPTQSVYIPVNKQEVLDHQVVGLADTSNIVSQIPLALSGKEYLTKDEIAILDIIASNIWERPIYFAVTTRPEKFFGLNSYMQLEGMALRLIPVQSPGEGTYGLIGYGRMDTDKLLDKYLNVFKWGNFDKKELYVDRSFSPSIQSLQLGMKRLGEALLREGRNADAIALTDKYFEAFPHMNFPYEYQTYYMLDIYLKAGAYDKAKPHLEILAEETVDKLEFFESIDPDIVNSSYKLEYDLARNTMTSLIADARENNDQPFQDYLQSLFAPYMQVPPVGQQPLRD